MDENTLPDLRQRAREWIAGFHEATEEDRVNCVALLLDAAEAAYQCAAEGHKSKHEDYVALVEQAAT